MNISKTEENGNIQQLEKMCLQKHKITNTEMATQVSANSYGSLGRLP